MWQWCVGGVGSALRTSTMPSVWPDSTGSYFHATPNAHWRPHLRQWTRRNAAILARTHLPDAWTTVDTILAVNGSVECQKPPHGFYRKDHHGAELLQFPAVCLLLPSPGCFFSLSAPVCTFSVQVPRAHVSEAATVTSPPVLTES